MLRSSGKSAGLGVGALCREDDVAKPLMSPVEQLGEKRLVVAVGSVVQAQAARGERRDSGAGLRNQRSCFPR